MPTGAFDFQNQLRESRDAIAQAISGDHDMKNWSDSARNMVYQSALAGQANAHELEMWNLQNEYNSPKAQMQRFKEAGLNPMLAYTQGNPGNSSHAPQVHVPNAEYHPDADRIQKINAALSIVSAVNDMIGQAMGVADAGIDLQLKRNELDWSNYQSSVAAYHLLGYGAGRRAGQHGWLGSNSIESYLDPSDPNFDPTAFNLLQRMGITQYYPRQMTAEANAALSAARKKYQDDYNKNVLPLLDDYYQGKIDYTAAQNKLLQYQDQALEAIPPEIRGILEPILRYLTPILNGLLRRR